MRFGETELALADSVCRDALTLKGRQNKNARKVVFARRIVIVRDRSAQSAVRDDLLICYGGIIHPVHYLEKTLQIRIVFIAMQII
jgi:hypothetical protein